MWEGGVRTPFVAHWPNHFPAGAVGEDLFALTDVLATLAAVVDYKLPDDTAQDNYLLSVLQGDAAGERQTLVVKASNNTFGLRWKNWKYIQGKENKAAQLYTLSTDESETQSVLIEHPQVAEEIDQKLVELLNSDRTVPQR